MADTLLGRPIWYELLTTDMKAAEAFYTPVVEWTVQPFEGSGQPYDTWIAKDGKAAGGVMKVPEGMNWPPHWVFYVGTRTLEKTVADADRLGARAMSEVIAIPTVGRLRVMQDPQGAMFALFEPTAQDDVPETPPTDGHTAWHELYTTDAEAAMTFYTQLFGWKPTEAMDMGEMGKYHMFGRAFPLGGMMNKTKEMAQMPSHWGLYFEVPDVDTAAARVTANGGQILNGPMDVPGGGRIVNCMDPQGAAFSLHRRARG